MSKCVALSVSLTTELAVFVAEKVGSGRFGRASEVVRMGLRLLEEKDRALLSPQTRGKAKVVETSSEL